MVIVTQSFGREEEYRRAIFAIDSFFAFQPIASKVCVYLFTDNAPYFEPYLSGYNVKYENLTLERIRNMRGRYDFLHRMKICLIEETLLASNEKILYFDSDTFFLGDPSSVLAKVEFGCSAMHEREYQFKDLRKMTYPAAKTFHEFVSAIASSEFLLGDESRVRISEEEYSWNAGVMILSPNHLSLMPHVFALTDQFYAASENHASEQYAFSVVLSRNSNVIPIGNVVYHYWYRVKKRVMDAFLAKRITPAFCLMSQDERTKKIRTWTSRLPEVLKHHPMIVKDKAIQAFHEKKIVDGYYFAVKGLFLDPLDFKFLKDVLYHTKCIFVRI